MIHRLLLLRDGHDTSPHNTVEILLPASQVLPSLLSLARLIAALRGRCRHARAHLRIVSIGQLLASCRMAKHIVVQHSSISHSSLLCRPSPTSHTEWILLDHPAANGPSRGAFWDPSYHSRERCKFGHVAVKGSNNKDDRGFQHLGKIPAVGSRATPSSTSRIFQRFY